MQRTRHIRRLIRAGLATLTGLLLACAAGGPAALATPPPRPPGWNKHPPLPVPNPPIHAVIAGGMPGWQITLIAAATALLTAALAVLADRKRQARRPAATAGP
jgi:hypothetical protein